MHAQCPLWTKAQNHDIFYYCVFVLFSLCSSQGFGWVITIHRKDDSYKNNPWLHCSVTFWLSRPSSDVIELWLPSTVLHMPATTPWREVITKAFHLSSKHRSQLLHQRARYKHCERERQWRECMKKHKVAHWQQPDSHGTYVQCDNMCSHALVLGYQWEDIKLAASIFYQVADSKVMFV